MTSCKGDTMVVLGKVKPTGSALRKVRGAKLQMRFGAFPLFGLPRRGGWHDLGAKKSGTSSETFTGLTADSWIGVVSFRFRKGRRTVLSGTRRSEALKVGSSRGRAFCTLEQGFRVIDKTPPELFPVPADDRWYRGPAKAYVVAQDEYPGVAKVSYSLDHGPVTDIKNGAPLSIEAEGPHTIDWSATDADGNTASRAVTVRVDTSAPTKPQFRLPHSVTASGRPTFQWTASTDSGSGLRGYLLSINRAADGAQVVQVSLDANTTSATPADLQDGVSYTATVTAIDNTSDAAFTTSSDPLSFRVDRSPEVTGSDPGQGAVLTGSRKDGNLTLTLDRPADPATVSNNTVVLDRLNPSSDPAYTLTCSSPCTTITVDPSGTLDEGRYRLSLNNVQTEENIGFAPFTLSFAAAFFEDSAGASATSGNCLAGSPSNTSMTTALNNAASETIRVSFNWALSGTGTGFVRVRDNGVLVGSTSTPRSAGSGSDSLEVTLSSAPSHTLVFEVVTTGCGAGQSVDYDVTNVVASRTP